MLTLNLLVIIPGLVTKSWTNIYVAVGSLFVIIVLFVLRKVVKKRYQYLTLAALFFWNLDRFILIGVIYEEASKVLLYFQGYLYASIQLIVLSRIQNTPLKIMIIAVSFGLRYAILTGLIDKGL